MLPSGVLTTLCAFNGTNGALPYGRLVEGADGNFYQHHGQWHELRLERGWPWHVFRMTPNGALTTLCSFNGSNGALPSGLVQARDGNFYGTTISGGDGDNGTIFKVTREGMLTTLLSLSVTNGCGHNAGLDKE